MSRFGTCALTLFALAGLFGCSDDAGPSTASAGTGGGAGAGGGAGVGGSGAGAGGAEALSFAADIFPILSMKCAGSNCHGRDQGMFQPAHGSANVDEAYAATQQPGSMGEPVYERILVRVTSDVAMMPPDYANPPCPGEVGAPGCISEAELALLEAWVEQGALP